jgi:hypothetical protein
MADYAGISTECHDGSAGVHLAAADHPSANCYQLPASQWQGTTAQEQQDWVNNRLSADGEPGSVTITSLDPLAFAIQA